MVYVGLLQPYGDPSHVNLETQASTEVAFPRIAASTAGYLVSPANEVDPSPGLVPGPQPIIDVPHAREGVAPRALTLQWSNRNHHGTVSMCRPPPVLFEKQARRMFQVERLLQRRRRYGQNQYLVKWPGYPE